MTEWNMENTKKNEDAEEVIMRLEGKLSLLGQEYA